MPCIAWKKKLKFNIYQCNWNIGFANQQGPLQPRKHFLHGWLCRHSLTLYMLRYMNFQHKVFRLVRWVGLFF